MISVQSIFDYMASFPEVSISPHFEKKSFRIGKKIWATWDEKKLRLCVKLITEDQDVFCAMASGKVYAVPDKWGQQGWTFVDPLAIETPLLIDILHESYKIVAPPRLWILIPDSPL